MESVQSHGRVEVREPDAVKDYDKEDMSADTEKETPEEKEDSSVDGFVVMEAAIEQNEENETDNKPGVAIGCGMEYNEEKITVEDIGSKEEPTDLDSTDSPCPSETGNINLGDPNQGSREELDGESIELSLSTNKNVEVNGEKSNSDEIEINDEERSMMVNMFKMFDSDGTGAMSIAELGNFMRAIGD